MALTVQMRSSLAITRNKKAPERIMHKHFGYCWLLTPAPTMQRNEQQLKLITSHQPPQNFQIETLKTCHSVSNKLNIYIIKMLVSKKKSNQSSISKLKMNLVYTPCSSPVNKQACAVDVSLNTDQQFSAKYNGTAVVNLPGTCNSLHIYGPKKSK